MNWLILIKEELGDAWLNNNMFRIGASGIEMSMKFRESIHIFPNRLFTIKHLQQSKLYSGLLLDIERQLFHWVTGRYAAAHELAMS